jgi:uncharacterized protein (UPF0179 family)
MVWSMIYGKRFLYYGYMGKFLNCPLKSFCATQKFTQGTFRNLPPIREVEMKNKRCDCFATARNDNNT